MIETVRLILAAVLLSFAWMTVFRAPRKILWLFAIGLTELPWIFSFVSLLLVLPPYQNDWKTVAGISMSVIAFAFFISPVFRAGSVSRRIPALLKNSLGIENFSSPFSPAEMFFPSRIKKTKPESFVYTERADGSKLSFDFYRSAGKKSPFVIVVHGGSWSAGNSQQLSEVNHHLVAMGYSVASINYSLAPRYQYPQPVDDLDAAIRFLQNNAEEFCLDRGNFFLLGRSAGGQIALMAAYRRKIPGLRGVISYYAPADMIWAGKVARLHTIINSTQILRDYLGAEYETDPELYRTASPIETVTSEAPPALLFHGLRDELVYPHHADELEKKLRRLNVPVAFIRMPWATHGFDAFLSGPGGQISRKILFAFLQHYRADIKTKSAHEINTASLHSE